MKKILLTIFFIIFIFSNILENTFAIKSKNSNYFIVTAYYSPLPNQSHYMMGSYEKEIIMNGKGTHGASGKKVFSGMIAAPSKYPFGTKIYLKGLGILEVADRGGAIVKAGERKFKYDRIDIWCGYGEEGLQRAMFWGTRTIKGNIINKNNKVNFNIKKIPAPKWTKFYAKKNPKFIRKKIIKRIIYLNSLSKTPKKIEDNNIFDGPIKNSSGVIQLQKILKEMKLYSGKINGKYSDIRNIILDFQLKNNVISKKTDIGAGNFGPKTRKTLKEKYNLFLKNKILKRKKQEEEKKKKEILEKKKKKLKNKYSKKIKSLGYIKYGDISAQVRELQIILKKLGYFKYKDTAIFGPKTKNSLIKYQISKKLIKNKNSKGAGIFGPNTKNSLIDDLTKKELEK